jgi:AraC-like DNA-binding protein/ligand-binding sensor protein
MDVANQDLVQRLSRSKIYADYQAAFGAATGLPLSLRSMGEKHPINHGAPRENPFCALMAQSTKSCAACLEVQQSLTSGEGAQTVTCFAGLTDTAVPLKVGDETLGYLQTGQVLLEEPTSTQFARTARHLIDWGYKTDLRRMEDAWFHSRVIEPEQYTAMVRLVSIFAEHLASVANQLAVQQQQAEPPVITRAKKYIQEHQEEEIGLADVAKAVNTSSFYFCKLFKKATGLNFTDYVARVRVEKAKNLLLNPNARVSEVAFDSGFQSLTHFNRVFRRVAGSSPTVYRQQLSLHA